jgi:hypothetical protein
VQPAGEQVVDAGAAEAEKGMGPDRAEQRDAQHGRDQAAKPDQHRLSDRSAGLLL